MKIRVVKKLLAAMWYKIGQEFEVIREDRARLGNSHCFLATYIVKVEGIERMILKQDAEEVIRLFEEKPRTDEISEGEEKVESPGGVTEEEVEHEKKEEELAPGA